MATRTELTDTLIALIPEDGSRISNAEIKAALEKEAGDSISEAELKELKSHVIAMEAAEAAKGPGGGLKAPGIDPPPRTGAAAKKKNSAATPQSAIAHGTGRDSVLTDALDKHVTKGLQVNRMCVLMGGSLTAGKSSGEKK